MQSRCHVCLLASVSRMPRHREGKWSVLCAPLLIRPFQDHCEDRHPLVQPSVPLTSSTDSSLHWHLLQSSGARASAAIVPEVLLVLFLTNPCKASSSAAALHASSSLLCCWLLTASEIQGCTGTACSLIFVTPDACHSLSSFRCLKSSSSSSSKASVKASSSAAGSSISSCSVIGLIAVPSSLGPSDSCKPCKRS